MDGLLKQNRNYLHLGCWFGLPCRDQNAPSSGSASLVSCPCSDLLSAYHSRTSGELVLVALSQIEPRPVLHGTCWLNATHWCSDKKKAREQWNKIEENQMTDLLTDLERSNVMPAYLDAETGFAWCSFMFWADGDLTHSISCISIKKQLISNNPDLRFL